MGNCAGKRSSSFHGTPSSVRLVSKDGAGDQDGRSTHEEVSFSRHLTSPLTVPRELRNAGRHGGEPLITHTEEVPANLCSSTTPDHAVNRNPKLLLRGRIGRRVRFGCLLDHLNATVSPWDGAVGFVISVFRPP